ncbi:sugar ABC transporter permease [Kaistia algarum]|uniref:carbohydrate ABC transporter permease n=1 Tax=Kaistia algarum TaxID=2083279 RepID=UPI000CE8D332|nr:sugar ABC transporter permease [Kaistia algarum]MCX5513950.1 sugar ABC transporter permease [Kaistia algarum]PPE78075.1 sugar ABC transporter permease [Kaistia algarum]
MAAAVDDLSRPAPQAGSRSIQRGVRRETLLALTFIVPGVTLAVLFKLVPLLRGFYLSLLETQGFEDPTFAGLANYRTMLDDPVFLGSFRNAMVAFATLPVWVLLPLVLAVLIFQRSPGWKFFRATFFLPYMIAPIVVGIMFRQILAPDGPLNALLRAIGLAPLAIEWLNGPNSALLSLTAVALWSFFGLGVLTYLSGLATISEDIIEAARLDGAGFWSLLFRIIMPLIKPVIGYWTVLCTSGILIWMFPLIYALTKGGPGNATTLPEYLVFTTTFQFMNRGLGAAIGMALFVFVAIVSAFVVRRMYAEGRTS